jgi:hypothetical protein
MTMQQIEDYEAICDLLERTKREREGSGAANNER